MNASSDQISVQRYLDPIRRFAPLVLVGALVGAGLGFAAHTLSGTSYTSGVSVLVSPISGDPVDGLGTSVVEVDMATEAEVATSLVVAERANDLLAGQPPAKDPRDLLGQIETSVRGTRIIEMSFTAVEPEIAQRGAEAFAEAFLAYRDELAQGQLEVSSGRLEERIAQLQLELTDVSTRRAEVPEAERDGAAYAALVINEQTLLDELSVNQGRLADLRAVITDDAVVLDAASLPRSPSSLSLTTLFVGGAAAGFVLAAGLALMLDAARRRGEDEESVEVMAARQVLEVPAEDAEAHAVPVPPVAPIPTPTEVGASVADASDLGAPSAFASDPNTPHIGWSPAEPAAASVDLEPAAETPSSWEPPIDAATAEASDASAGDALGLPASADAGAPPLSDDPPEETVDRWSPTGETAEEPSPTEPMVTDHTATDPDASLEEIPDPFAAVDRPDGREGLPVDDLGGSSDPSTPWDQPVGGIDGDTWAVADPDSDDPWAGVDASPWSFAGETASAPALDAPAPAEPVDLGHVLQERALTSVAQLGDHLTQPVDLERRVLVVVDGGDGAAQPVAVAMAAHLAAGGRQSVLVDLRGEVLPGVAAGRHQVRDHPTLELVVCGIADDTDALVDDCAREAAVVVLAGEATASPLVAAAADWPGAIVVATAGVANPASIPEAAFDQVMQSQHPLIGIVSIMARPAMAPPGA